MRDNAHKWNSIKIRTLVNVKIIFSLNLIDNKIVGMSFCVHHVVKILSIFIYSLIHNFKNLKV